MLKNLLLSLITAALVACAPTARAQQAVRVDNTTKQLSEPATFFTANKIAIYDATASIPRDPYTVLAGPSSGVTAVAPTWRRLSATDIIATGFGGLQLEGSHVQDVLDSADAILDQHATALAGKQAASSNLDFWSATTPASGVAAWISAPTSVGLGLVLGDETGSGSLVFNGSPTFTGTPTAPTAAAATNTTQIATTAHVFAERSNAATFTNKSISLGSNTVTGTSAQLATAISDETGTGAAVFAGSPTFTGIVSAPALVGGSTTAPSALSADGYQLYATNAGAVVNGYGGSNDVSLLARGSIALRVPAGTLNVIAPSSLAVGTDNNQIRLDTVANTPVTGRVFSNSKLQLQGNGAGETKSIAFHGSSGTERAYMTPAGDWVFSSGTASTSATTGALTITGTGGLGVQGNINSASSVSSDTGTARVSLTGSSRTISTDAGGPLAVVRQGNYGSVELTNTSAAGVGRWGADATRNHIWASAGGATSYAGIDTSGLFGIYTGGLNVASAATNGIRVFNTSDQTTNTESLGMYFSGNSAYLTTQNAGTGTRRQFFVGDGGNAASTVLGGGFGSVTLRNLSPHIEMARTVSSAATTAQVTSTNTATSGTNNAFAISASYNQASGTAANTDLLINRTQTAVGSGTQRLIDAQVGGNSMFNVSNVGTTTADGTANGTLTNTGLVVRGGNGASGSPIATFQAFGGTVVARVNSNGALAAGVANFSINPWGFSGAQFQTGAVTATDNLTATSGTVTNAVFSSYARPTLAANNTGVTTTNAATLYVANAPLAGTNMTITNPYALWVDDGVTRLDGGVQLTIGAGIPATSSSAGVAGTVVVDADYIYVCTATNTWKRSALSTW